MIPTLLRCWGFGLALVLAITLAAAGLVLWGERPLLPLIRLPVPMPTLFPVLTTLLLTWTLQERWRAHLATSVRPAALVPAARFAGTQATCMAAAALASAMHSGSTVVIACSSIGASLAAPLTLLLGRRASLALAMCAYLWLVVAVRSPALIAGQRSIGLAVATLVLSGSTYVWFASRQPTTY